MRSRFSLVATYPHLDAQRRAVIGMTRYLVLCFGWSHHQARAFALSYHAA